MILFWSFFCYAEESEVTFLRHWFPFSAPIFKIFDVQWRNSTSHFVYLNGKLKWRTFLWFPLWNENINYFDAQSRKWNLLLISSKKYQGLREESRWGCLLIFKTTYCENFSDAFRKLLFFSSGKKTKHGIRFRPEKMDRIWVMECLNTRYK